MWRRIPKSLRSLAALCGLSVAVGCSDLDEPVSDAEKILEVTETESWSFPQLSQPVQVVRTESNVPHIYAHNRTDLGFVLGFVTARERYFMLDLNRRLATGTISELFGDAALEIDQESRGTGMSFVAEQIAASFSPELEAYADAFAAGINAYIEEVKEYRLPPPSELEIPAVRVMLSIIDPTELMEPFDRYDVAAMLATIIYESGYETGDVGRAATVAKLPTLFAGATKGYLRRRGAIEDMWQSIEPLKPIASAPDWGGGAATARSFRSATASKADGQMLQRLIRRLERQQKRLNRDSEAGFGSNAWAVSGQSSTDGAALMAGDGHLSLAIPSIVHRLGLDLTVFGGGELRQLGLTIPGLPLVVLGTNGHIAWSQTQMSCDITDWYLEQMELDADGKPARTLFQGEWRDLEAFDEKFIIADVPLLESVGREETWTRWVTFDGRWIADIEGRDASPDEELAEGETLVNLKGDYVVPGDVDGDGVVTAVSFDYAGFEAGATFAAYDAIGQARDVHEFSEAAEALVASSTLR